MSVLLSNQTSPSLGDVGADPTSNLINADAVVDALICKLAVGDTTPIPILPLVAGTIEGFPDVVEYVSLPKRIPPIFILLGLSFNWRWQPLKNQLSLS